MTASVLYTLYLYCQSGIIDGANCKVLYIITAVHYGNTAEQVLIICLYILHVC